GTLQAASSETLFGHGNNFTVGLSIDRGLVQFSTTSELGTVNANQFPLVQGVGSLHRPTLGRRRAGRPGGSHSLHRPVRDRYLRRDVALLDYRRRALEFRPDQP